jgi:hypothetical protein
MENTELTLEPPADGWGKYGDQPPCEHLLALRRFLEENQMEVIGDDTFDPYGWVNVTCNKCSRCYEVTLNGEFEP